MMQRFGGLALRGVAAAVPETVLEVAGFAERFGEQAVARFRQIVGVERFPVAPEGVQASYYAEAAARDLLAAGVFRPEEIDAVLFVSQTPDAVAPTTASRLQGRFGLGEQTLALDLNQGCAGFLTGLLTAAHLLGHPACRNVLLLGGDTLSRLVDPADQTSAMLFGDAGFAAVVGKGGADAWTIASASAPSEAIALPHGGRFQMSGTDVFNFSITRVPEQIQAVLAATGESREAIDLVLLHQANAFILRQIARMTGFPEARVPCRMAGRGNTSVASLPLLLCDLAGEGMRGVKRALLSAFGVGLTWMTARLNLDFCLCRPTVACPAPRE